MADKLNLMARAGQGFNSNPLWGIGLKVLGGIGSSAWNWWQGNKQTEFQERMASTQHQREVEDLKKAGLNPILSAGGSGAMAPVGAFFRADNPMEGLPEAAQKKSELELQQATTAVNIRKIIEEANNIFQDSENKAKTEKILDQQLLTEQERTKQVKLANQMTRYHIPEARSLAEYYDAVGKYGKGAEKLAPIIGDLAPRLKINLNGGKKPRPVYRGNDYEYERQLNE